jgi:hypothetical protein
MIRIVAALVLVLAVGCDASPDVGNPDIGLSPIATTAPSTHASRASLFATCMEHPELLPSAMVAQYRPTHGGNVYTALCYAVTHKGKLPDPRAFG